MRLSVISYNIHKGFSVGNEHFVLEEIRAALKNTKVDLVGLQEVQGIHKYRASIEPRWPMESQLEFLADTVWPHFSYGRNAIYQEGHHGNAILSRHPLSDTTNHDISKMWFSRRGILHGVILGQIHVACVHMGFLPIEQGMQFKLLKKWLKDEVPPRAPVILMGDFNDWHGLVHRRMTQQLKLQEVMDARYGRLGKTYPSWSPKMPMDRIYFRNLPLLNAGILRGSPWERLSDHCPVSASFHIGRVIDKCTEEQEEITN